MKITVTMVSRHTVEDRSSPVCMGVQRRIVSREGHTGPWVCGTMSEVWKAYKRMRWREYKQGGKMNTNKIVDTDKLIEEMEWLMCSDSCCNDKIEECIALVKKHSVVETPKPEPAKERLMICEHWKECDGVSCGKRHIVPHVEVGVCRSYGCDAKPGAKCIPYVEESAKPDCICGETGARNCPEHNEPPTLEARIAALEAKEAKLVGVLDEMVTHLERLHLTCFTSLLREALAKYKENL